MLWRVNKMNKFIKLPLFLGGVCLFFGAALAAVCNVCQPIIDRHNLEKRNATYLKLYEGVDATTIEDVEEESYKGYRYIDALVKVPHGGVSSYVYSLTTADPQSGALSFMMGINASTGLIDAYSFLNSSNSDGYLKNFKDNEQTLTDLTSYSNGGTFVGVSGATKTKNVVKDAVDEALAHFKSLGGNA